MNVSLSPDLFVSDLERSVTFYKKALGLEELDQAAGPEGPFFSMMGREGFRIMLGSPKSPGTQEMQRRLGSTPRATILLYLSVDDLAAEERRLKAAGVSYHGPVIQPYGMKEVSLRTPTATHGRSVRRWSSGSLRPSAVVFWRRDPGERAVGVELLDARVLVVDDDHDTLEIMRVILDAYGAQTAVAATAAEAFAALRTMRPEVLLSDISLPGEDGYDLLRRVRALSTEDGGDTPAVAISAHVYTADRERAFDAGFQAFLAKPINPAALVECVRSMVERGRANLERRRGPRRTAHSTLDTNSERRTFERRQPFSRNPPPHDN